MKKRSLQLRCLENSPQEPWYLLSSLMRELASKQLSMQMRRGQQGQLCASESKMG